MSVAELKSQVEKLSLEERRELTAYLISLRHKEMDSYREKLAHKIDDASDENWLSMEEFDKRLDS